MKQESGPIPAKSIKNLFTSAFVSSPLPPYGNPYTKLFLLKVFLFLGAWVADAQ